MPELPEVETVRRGLQPWLEGARIDHVTLNRPDLRFPFPAGPRRSAGGQHHRLGRPPRQISAADARPMAATLLSHLGMTGSWRFAEHGIDKPPRYYETGTPPKHDHLVLDISHPNHGKSHLIYADPRRFGFVDLYDDLADQPLSAGSGARAAGQ